MTSRTREEVIVRSATEADISSIVDMGCRFIEKTDYANFITPNPDAMTVTVATLIQHHAVFVLQSSAGILMGMLGIMTYPHVVSGEVCASELFWWVEPEYRGFGLRMLRAAESWAKSRGAVVIQMVQPVNECRLGEIYERFGYTKTEVQFQKRLS